ncbi:MAG: DegV family protein [Acidimicrobiales bacterium]
MQGWGRSRGIVAGIRVVTDSACDVPQDIATALGIEIVSLTIRFGDEEYVDRVELSPADFWRKCATSTVLPETAAPSAGAFRAAYERAHDEGAEGVIVLTLSASLSATFQAASVAAEDVADVIPVTVIDTKAVTIAEGLIVIDVAEAARAGDDLAQLVTRAHSLIERVGVCAMLDTLEHLVKGGRIGGARALLGQVLAIKPILELKDGVVAEAGRQRTRPRALAVVAQRARDHVPLRRLAIVHGASPEVDTLRALIRDIASEYPVIVTDMGPVVGTHGGPGIIGLAWIQASGPAN